jgi:ATP-binding cassette, subfamily B, bacterial
MKYFAPLDAIDCGLACLRMIAYHHGKEYSTQYLRKHSFLTRQGMSLYVLGKTAEKIGFKVMVGELSLKYLKTKAALPCILYWDKSHFVVLHKISKKKNWFTKKETYRYHIADPGKGKLVLSEEQMKEYWLGDSSKGFGLFLETTQSFFNTDEAIQYKTSKRSANPLHFLSTYFSKYKKNYFQVIFAMSVAALISLIIPYLTQSIVDTGINQKNINFVSLIIIFQLVLYVSSTIIEVIRSQLLMHISTRVNMSILSDFLIKLLRLPLTFFDSKLAGDVMQRINDHQRIENFINTAILSTVFSILNMFIFTGVLFSFGPNLLWIFLTGSALAVAWTLFFMKKRKSLDYIRFRELSHSSDKMYEMVHGMPEIKLNSFEYYKQIEWQEIQHRVFRLNLSNLTLNQYQNIGSGFINQIKNLLITYVVASSVISGNMTLGMMLAVSYIVGQLNVPVAQLSEFINNWQFAKIAIERMNEVYNEDDEEKESNIIPIALPANTDNKGIEIKNLSFQYEGPDSKYVLKDISLKIPENKVTAIVGSSGSGKTTLLKLLLKFYQPVSGEINLNGIPLQNISSEWWRDQCGTVMQEGYIFSDTIKRNIIMGEETEDIERLIHAVEASNIDDFIVELPMNFDTKIGAAGAGISTGQKQRLLLARAIYKKPSYLFFDEATSALDARNERQIMQNLNEFFIGKTVVIVAHRLSTVKNADQIVVIEDGQIVETGKHSELVSREGHYYNLVKNQLELGK